jgi:hypothetical protein
MVLLLTILGTEPSGVPWARFSLRRRIMIGVGVGTWEALRAQSSPVPGAVYVNPDGDSTATSSKAWCSTTQQSSRGLASPVRVLLKLRLHRPQDPASTPAQLDGHDYTAFLSPTPRPLRGPFTHQ